MEGSEVCLSLKQGRIPVALSPRDAMRDRCRYQPDKEEKRSGRVEVDERRKAKQTGGNECRESESCSCCWKKESGWMPRGVAWVLRKDGWRWAKKNVFGVSYQETGVQLFGQQVKARQGKARERVRSRRSLETLDRPQPDDAGARGTYCLGSIRS